MLLLWREVFASLALRVSVFSSVFLVRLTVKSKIAQLQNASARDAW